MKPSRYFIQFEDTEKVNKYLSGQIDAPSDSALWSAIDVPDVEGKNYLELCELAHEAAKKAASDNTGHAGVYERRGLYDAGDYYNGRWLESWEYTETHVSDCTSEVCE